jgi:hypothetical protein
MALLIAMAVGCGGGSGLDPDLAVVDLETTDQVDLCQRFIDDVCSSGEPLVAEFCADDCKTSSCQSAADDGHIDEECSTQTVGDVEDCGESAEISVCARGGGCMFDAVEAACSGT